jgi:folate-binding protein YgfZ
MAHPSPLRPFYERADAAFMPFGPEVQVVAQVAPIELEYAALRKGAAMLDCPHRGLLKLTGKDRLDFLHRMTTHECRSLAPGQVRRMFLLSAKGRIMADLLVIHDEAATWIDLEAHDAGAVTAELNKLLFTEDVAIHDLSDTWHRVSFHGPRAADFLDWARTQKPFTGLRYGWDETGSPGLHIWSPTGEFGGIAGDDESLRERFGLRDIGWLSYNIARLEAGCPLFHIDFGPDSLPHETGLIDQAVSFTKGCYRGQEIVARMQNLGHPAKVLVGFRGREPQVPVAGAPIHESPESAPAVVGAVTSSTFSPMNSQAPIGLAMVKWGFHEPGRTLYTPAGSGLVPIQTHPPGDLHDTSTRISP